MGADNHPTVQVQDDNNVPSVNGHELDSLEGVEAAFEYLTKDYNDGDITRNLDGDRVLVTARGARFQHLGHVLEAHEGGHVTLVDAYATHDGRQRIEIAE